MKKIVSFFALLFFITISFAQVQRVKHTTVSKDSATTVAGSQKADQGKKKEMMRELNLSKEQKSKLKEIKQAHKSQMDEIQNDAKLSAEEKKAKLKALKMEQLKKTMAVLNDEQKARFKELRKQNRQGDEDASMEEKK